MVSGDLDALEALERALSADGVRCRRVDIGFAAHSAHMDGILEAFREALAELRPRASTIPFYSSVTESVSTVPRSMRAIGAATFVRWSSSTRNEDPPRRWSRRVRRARRRSSLQRG